MRKFINSLGPHQLLVLGFGATIFIGAILLTLPIASEEGTATNFLDALFTATSAVCVTGLVVVDTANYWSTFGEIVIMLLIQVGGLGIMTFAGLFAILLGKKIGLRERLVLQEALNKVTISGVVKLVRQILIASLIIEAVGAIVLALRFLQDMSLGQAVYYGIFHSISAFNNAGFDLFGAVSGEYTSLTSFVTDPIVSLMIALLFIIGGLGFSVLMQIVYIHNRKRWSLHTKIVLLTSLILLGVGFFVVLALEWSNPNTLRELSFVNKLVSTFFTAATPRTAGFNVLDTAGLRVPTQFFIIALMFIGASSGSTGGGVKTTTFASVILATRAVVTGKGSTTAFKRTIPTDLVAKASAIVFISLSWVILVTLLLAISEAGDFLTILFEATSAFGTVGLSMGLTGSLSEFGRVLIIITMFLGRLGPLTLMYAIAQRQDKVKYRYQDEQMLVG